MLLNNTRIYTKGTAPFDFCINQHAYDDFRCLDLEFEHSYPVTEDLMLFRQSYHFHSRMSRIMNINQVLVQIINRFYTLDSGKVLDQSILLILLVTDYTNFL